MNNKLSVAMALASLAFVGQANAQLVVYENDGFSGQSLTANQNIENLKRQGFNDRGSSATVTRDRWEVCDGIRFSGNCVVLRPGRYSSLSAVGLNDRISSMRVVQSNAQYDTQYDDQSNVKYNSQSNSQYNSQYDDNRYVPDPAPVYDDRQRNGRTYEAQVVSVRAVVTQDNRQCWVERERVGGQYRDGGKNVGGAVVGAVIGGILGHQVGGGKGRDFATAVGVIAGAAVGANTNRNGQRGYEQNVQRCSGQYGGNAPQYWDVIYSFRGQEYRMQTTYPPGPTIIVNSQGEPQA